MEEYRECDDQEQPCSPIDELYIACLGRARARAEDLRPYSAKENYQKGVDELDPRRLVQDIFVDHVPERYESRVEQIRAAFPASVRDQIFTNGDDGVTPAEFHQALFPGVLENGPLAVGVARSILTLTVRPKGQLVKRVKSTRNPACPQHYTVRAMDYGCVFDCEYCNRQTTFRPSHPYMRLYVNYEDIVEQMAVVAAEENARGNNACFNMGEHHDSLVFEPMTGQLAFVLQRFAEDPRFAKSELLLSSKSSEIGVLLDFAKRYPQSISRVVPSWSVNTPRAAQLYEHDAATVPQRLAVAKTVQDVGYRVRLSIGPLIPHEGWYLNLPFLPGTIYRDFGLRPEVVTINALRFAEPIPEISRARFPYSDLFRPKGIEKGASKSRLNRRLRLKMFRALIKQIRFDEPNQKIALCKEGPGMWRELGLDVSPECAHSCNCTTGWTFGDIQTA